MCPTSLLSVSLRPCERVIPYQLRTFQFMSCIFSWEKKNLLKTCKKNHIAWLAYNIWIKKNVWHYGLNLISLGIKCFMKSVHTFSFVSWYRSITLKKQQKKPALGIVKIYSKIAAPTLNNLPHLSKVRTWTWRRPSQSWVPRCRTSRLKKSWVHAARSLLSNSTLFIYFAGCGTIL